MPPQPGTFALPYSSAPISRPSTSADVDMTMAYHPSSTHGHTQTPVQVYHSHSHPTTGPSRIHGKYFATEKMASGSCSGMYAGNGDDAKKERRRKESTRKGSKEAVDKRDECVYAIFCHIRTLLTARCHAVTNGSPKPSPHYIRPLSSCSPNLHPVPHTSSDYIRSR